MLSLESSSQANTSSFSKLHKFGTYVCRQCQKVSPLTGTGKRSTKEFCEKACHVAYQKQAKALKLANEEKILNEQLNLHGLQCKLCSCRALSSLQEHIKQIHKMTPTKYYAETSSTPADVYSAKLRQDLSDKVTGDKNPAYQHGGRLSPFSTKFKNYATPEEAEIGRAAAFSKLSATQRDHGNTSLKFYLNLGMTEDEATQALSERQATFTLEKCIARHGEEGKEIFADRQLRWQATLDAKPDDEIERINNLKIWKSGGVSKQSISLFEKIDSENARWSAHGGEVMIKLIFDGITKRKMIDFKLDNKIIEYFGTYWHADPRKYSDDAIMIQKRNGPETAGSIREHDRLYLSLLKEAGFRVLVIWEHDFTTNPIETIQKCKDFLAS